MNGGESVVKTLTLATVVALVCSLLVATTVHWLRPRQLAYGAVERNRAILEATGLVDAMATLSERAIVDRFLELDARVVDLETDDFAPSLDAASYDPLAFMDDPAYGVAISPEDDVAGLGRRPRYLPVYLLVDGERIERLTLPIYARGMWSTIYGYLSLASDLNTIAGVEFHEHGETPGIGDRIESRDWQAQWGGKRLYDSSGELRFAIGAGREPSHEVDAITGATVTVQAVENAVRYWLGADGFGPLLARLRAESR